MTRYARISDGAVAEVIDTDKALSDLYHADIAADFVVVDDAVIAGMIRADDGTFSEPPAGRQPEELAARLARARRDKLLAETDWHVTRAIETGGTVSAEIAAYRQALRDLPEQDGFPDNIDWPVAPQ